MLRKLLPFFVFLFILFFVKSVHAANDHPVTGNIFTGPSNCRNAYIAVSDQDGASNINVQIYRGTDYTETGPRAGAVPLGSGSNNITLDIPISAFGINDIAAWAIDDSGSNNDHGQNRSHWLSCVDNDNGGSKFCSGVNLLSIGCNPNCTSLSGPSTVTAGTTANYTASFTSVNGELATALLIDGFNSELSYHPAGTTTITRTFSWTPSVNQAGTHTLGCTTWYDSIAQCKPGGGNTPLITCAGPGTQMSVTVNAGTTTPTPTPPTGGGGGTCDVGDTRDVKFAFNINALKNIAALNNATTATINVKGENPSCESTFTRNNLVVLSGQDVTFSEPIKLIPATYTIQVGITQGPYFYSAFTNMVVPPATSPAATLFDCTVPQTQGCGEIGNLQTRAEKTLYSADGHRNGRIDIIDYEVYRKAITGNYTFMADYDSNSKVDYLNGTNDDLQILINNFGKVQTPLPLGSPLR